MDTLEKQIAPASSPSSIEQQREQWFGELFHSLKTDKLLLETNTASKSTRDFYDVMMSKNVVASSAMGKEAFNKILTEDALIKYIVHVFKSGHTPQTLAFNISDSSLLVWAVVDDNDFAAERELYLAQAAINNEFLKADYRVSTTVVDASDRLKTPEHYQVLPLDKAREANKAH